MLRTPFRVLALVLCAASLAGQDSRPAPLVLAGMDAEAVRRAWPEIHAHLRNGGSLVQLDDGGIFAAPEVARRLLVGPLEPVADTSGWSVAAASGWDGPVAWSGPTSSLTVRFTTLKEFKDEDGSSGPRDAVLRPLVRLVDQDGVARGAPIVEVDRLRGDYAGGRWIFALGPQAVDGALKEALIARAREGASDFEARPVHATFAAGEPRRLRVFWRRPGLRVAGPAPAATEAAATWELTTPDGKTSSGAFTLRGRADDLSADVDLGADAAPRPGLCRVVVRLKDAPSRPNVAETGFVVPEPADLAAPPLRVSKDWLTRDGKPFPIVGTTYMASDVHRKFLFEPNPAAWDDDFAAMARAGINFVRTGIWTGWTRGMLDPGAVDEGVLRALEAYVATAARHRIYVCFTLFAFQPPTFGGTNPYLDPRALEGQRAWIRAIAGRFRGNPWIHYDLINEPSYSPADQLWTNRPVGDGHERRAWREFLVRRYGLGTVGDAERAARLRAAHRDAGDDPWALPTQNDQSYSMVPEGRSARRAADFGLFTNEVVAAWADGLRAEIRAVAGPTTLVTLGQDEGGTENRPAQLLHAHAVDYTALHNWWKNDDLLFDGLSTKAEGVPNLVSETGLMRLESMDGLPWRGADGSAKLLERKCALAFGARGAGVVQWAWNVNPYMAIDNEATIGLFRPDGTAKSEFDVLRRFAAFARRAAPRLSDYEPADVVVVLPHARVWSGRPKGFDGAKRIVRVLADRFGVAARCVSSFDRKAAGGDAVLLALRPYSEFGEEGSARDFDVEVAQCSFIADPRAFGRRRLVLGPTAASAPVALREPTLWGGRNDSPAWATFDQNAGEWLRKGLARGVAPSKDAEVWSEPLPLEFAREEEPLRALLKAALDAAGVATSPAEQPMTATVCLARDVALVTVVNETAVDGTRRVAIDGKPLDVVVAAGRARCLLVDRKSLAAIADSDAAP